jgi:hypothetical protein
MDLLEPPVIVIDSEVTIAVISGMGLELGHPI